MFRARKGMGAGNPRQGVRGGEVGNRGRKWKILFSPGASLKLVPKHKAILNCGLYSILFPMYAKASTPKGQSLKYLSFECEVQVLPILRFDVALHLITSCFLKPGNNV